MLVETAVCAALISIALSSLLLVVVTFGRGTGTNRETSACELALRDALERLHEMPLRDVFPSFNQDPGDDPLGPGTAPGPNFAVPDLEVRPLDADGMVGRFEFNELTGVPGLREDIADAGFGTPRDLNADLGIDGLDHAADCVLVPVRVRLEWTGATGDRSLVVHHLLSFR